MPFQMGNGVALTKLNNFVSWKDSLLIYIHVLEKLFEIPNLGSLTFLCGA